MWKIGQQSVEEYTAQKYNGTKGYNIYRLLPLTIITYLPPPSNRDAFKLVYHKVICTKLMGLETVPRKYFCNNYAYMYKHNF